MVEQVLFLRHLETPFNKQNRILGRSLEVPISSPTEIVCDVPVHIALSSTALRCRQTMDCFLAKNTVAHLAFTPELVERGMGKMEGQPRAKMVSAYPELFHSNKFLLTQTPPEGESFQAFYERASNFWEGCHRSYDGTLLICSHNQFLKMLYFVIHDIPASQELWQEVRFPCGVVEKIL